MAPQISRSEQAKLDELLSDIYRGIEALPDKSQGVVTTTAYDIKPAATASYQDNKILGGRAYVREYELPASSPLVRQHQREVAALRSPQEPAYASSSSSGKQQPHRSTLKRQTDYKPQQQQQEPQSLASFLTRATSSATPENKRRVRILDPQQATSSENYRLEPQADARGRRKGERVKYVNTNKLIYHQERNPDDDDDDDNNNDLGQHQDRDGDGEFARGYDDTLNYDENNNSDRQRQDDDYDDNIDGATRVEYYHTTWLDKQLGRASKRRSSKELNERQIKEKAMIEELKRSLKNGAITLRQSFKGGKKKPAATATGEFLDDQVLADSTNRHQHHPSSSSSSTLHHHNKSGRGSNRFKQQPAGDSSHQSVFGSGLATVPRNYNNNNNNNKRAAPLEAKHTKGQTLGWTKGSYLKEPEARVEAIPQSATTSINTDFDEERARRQLHQQLYPFDSVYQPESQQQQQQRRPADWPVETNHSKYSKHQMQSPEPVTKLEASPYSQTSRTLPHNPTPGKHQLLQSHYRGNLQKPTGSSLGGQNLAAPTSATVPRQFGANEMRYPAHNSNSMERNQQFGKQQQQQQQQQQPAAPPLGNTISSLPSATEVVRSALSRSSSQVSLNQLNKTINLLPNSPPPYGAASPMTPTQQLRAASPSLSPSPVRSPTGCNTADNRHQQYSSKTLGHQPHQHQQQQQQQQTQLLPGQTILHGTRTVGRPPQPSANQQQQQQQQQPRQQQQQNLPSSQQQQQPVYANPHASLMQHRMEQQMRQPNKNSASMREFNELDSLLRSLSPSSTGAYSSTHITPGFSAKPSQPTFGGYLPSQQQQQQHSMNKPNQPDIYAMVQKQQPGGQQQQQQQQQSRPAQQQQQTQYQPTTTTTNQQKALYTIDVTNKQTNENCTLRPQDISEFEPPIEILPSMEDYQNIGKLNPVSNRYWYKPNMSRVQAISLLKDKPQGTFIVRDSTSYRGAYGLAVRVSKLPRNVLNNANLRNANGDISDEYIRHFLIEPTGGGVRLKGYANEPVFDNLADLIYQHSLTEIALPCKLVIPRADIEDPKFNHKQKQFFDDFINSKEQAKHQPYERTSPDGGYRRYPGDVYVHNEHRIIFE